MFVSRHGNSLIAVAEKPEDLDYLESLGAEDEGISGTKRLEFHEKTVEILADYGATLDDELTALLAPADMWSKIEPLDLPNLKRPPLDHQKIAYRLLLEQKKFMLGMDMGTGKSNCAVVCMNHLFKHNKIDGAIIVTDASIVPVWHKELIPEDSDIEPVSLKGSKADRLGAFHYGLQTGKKVFIINYDGIRVISKQLLQLCVGNWLLVLDESQRVKDHKTARFRNLWKLIEKCNFPYIWCLTGTPLTQRPEDIFGQYCFIDTSIFGTPKHFMAFKATYTISNSRTGNATAYKNMDTFMHKLHSKCYRVKKSQVLDLPPKIYQKIPFELPKQIKKTYIEFINSSGMLSVPGHPKQNAYGFVFVCEHPFSILAKSRQIVSNYIYMTEDASDPYGMFDETRNIRDAVVLYSKAMGTSEEDIINPKVEWILNSIADSDCQWVIWFAHNADRMELERALIGDRISYVTIDGSVPIDARHDLQNKFRNGHARVLLGQPAAAGTGLTLIPFEHSQYKSQNVVYYNNGFKVGDRAQSEDRTHRIGTKHSVMYYDLIYEGTIEVSIFTMLQRRIELNSLLTTKENLDDPKIVDLLSGIIRV